MAVEQCSTTPIEIIRADSGTWSTYTGSKEQLIAAGFANESFFPVGKKRTKSRPHGDTGRFWSIKQIKGGIFTLRKDHEYQPLPQPKDVQYSCPAIFKDKAIGSAVFFLGAVMNKLSGNAEYSEYGERTLWVDDKSMQNILMAEARLLEAIRNARVVSKNKKPHLSIVK